MFDWLKKNKSRSELPEYSEIRRLPSRGLPEDLKARERSQEYITRREVLTRWLGEETRRPRAENPFFTELVARDQRGVVTLALPDGTRCLPVFSRPFRAFDYTRTLMTNGPRPAYMSSSPQELASMLGKLREMGIGQFVLDRCPRCSVAVAIDSASIRSADDLITCWIVSCAGELARIELYLEYARAAALAGKRLVARDVTLETAAHVSFEDPRIHFLLGQIAAALDDRVLLREAKDFLRFQGLKDLERRLDDVARSDKPDFEIINFAS